MTLDKAITINTINNDHNPDYTDAERDQAHQLGIEALEREKEIREISSKPHSATDILLKVGGLLPSETEGGK